MGPYGSTMDTQIAIATLQFSDIRAGAQYAQGWWTLTLLDDEQTLIAEWRDRDVGELCGKVFLHEKRDDERLIANVRRHLPTAISLRSTGEGYIEVLTEACPDRYQGA